MKKSESTTNNVSLASATNSFNEENQSKEIYKNSEINDLPLNESDVLSVDDSFNPLIADNSHNTAWVFPDDIQVDGDNTPIDEALTNLIIDQYVDRELAEHEDPKAVVATASGKTANVGTESSNWGSAAIAYDNDQMLAEAGFDTAYATTEREDDEQYRGIRNHNDDAQPEVTPDPEPEVKPEPEVTPDPEPEVKPEPEVTPDPEPEVKPDPEPEPKPLPVATITIDSISQDDVVTAAESNSPQTITGTVGGDVKAGDVVTVYLDGKEIGQATVVSNNGKLEWSLDVDGSTLLHADVDTVSATVTTTDKYGQVATDSATHDYTVDIQASITIDKITGDNVITQQEGHEAYLPVTGTVGKDVREGDTVTVTINGNEYQTTVKPDLTWEVEVTGEDILHADKATASVTTSYGTDKDVTVSAEQNYDVVIEATVTIETIGDDFVINKDESEGEVPVTGTTGGDVKEGDTITVTVNGNDYTTTVGKDGSWTVNVDGKDLIEHGGKPIDATVTTCDGAGHCANGEDEKGYDIDTTITADVEITVIAGDDYLNEDEAKGTVSISGIAGGDVKEGDTVTLTVDGKEIGTAIVEKNEDGDLVWTATGIDGETLANANVDKVTASVTATDDAGNSVTATNTHEYQEATLDAVVTITSIAGDNALNATEVKPGTMVEINGTVGGDVKAGDTVVVTVDGVKHEVTVNDDLTWTLDVDGSVLAGSKKPVVTADVVIKDKYGNTATDSATDSYIIPTLDVTITIDSVNGGDPITGKEHDANTPIEVTGKVDGDAKVGDTVTLKIGDNTVETKVIVLESGDLGYVVDVPAGMFTPDQNDAFDGEITAHITIKDNYGNVASDDADKEYETVGDVITGNPSDDELFGTGYNDLIISDTYVEKTNVNVNLVLDLSGSMSVKEVNVDDIHLDNNHKSGTLTLTLNDGREQSVEFGSMQELANWLNYAYGSPLGLSRFTPELKFTFPDGSKQVISNVYDDIGLESRINLAKNSVLEIVENYGESLDVDQLRNLEFSMITFATGVDAIKKFHWDFDKNTLVSNDGQTIADFLTHVEPLSGDAGKTDYDSSIVAAINAFTNTNTSNVIYFVTDGMDTVDAANGQFFDKNAVINNAGGSIDKFKPTIVPVAIGGTISNTPEANEVLEQIASLGQGYKPDNTGNSQVIIATNTAQLGDVVNDSFENIVNGHDVIHGGKGNDIIVADTLNNEWLLEQYGSGHSHMNDLLQTGVTLSEVLFAVAAKDQGVNVDDLTTKDVYQFVMKHEDNLVITSGEEAKGKNSLFGDEGQDILFGSSATDILTGGAGDDLMYGMNGNDILIADAGNDIMFGGKGDDTFKLDVLATNEETRTAIMDFEKGDSIDLSSILDNGKDSVDDILAHVSSAEVDGKDVNITFDGKHEVEIKGAAEAYGDLGTSTSDIVNNLFANNVFHNDAI
ncbi:Ig-like domain-containing protein [Photobacterium leiognathi]|uniref:Ig-like domain-containing protein n=1 Tax=Photobacterium leiognathi TaxID=553611 RepID=UPI002982A58B|nr:Ig-like domain-containing protein [Photobacterium leiognathi]